MDDILWQSDLPGLPPPRRGKVRDVYDLGSELLIVATDRLSAYDHVLQPGIPGKGKILNQLSNFWFERLAARVEVASAETSTAALPLRTVPARATSPRLSTAGVDESLSTEVPNRTRVLRASRVSAASARRDSRVDAAFSSGLDL